MMLTRVQLLWTGVKLADQNTLLLFLKKVAIYSKTYRHLPISLGEK